MPNPTTIKHLAHAVAEAGKIKIGGLGEERKAKDGKPYRLPIKFPHFIITTTERDGDGMLIWDRELMQALGVDDKPIIEIPIYVHSNHVDQVFPCCYAMYAGKKKVCDGDGETATRRHIQDGEYTGATKQVECPCDQLVGPTDEAKGRVYCKPHGTLRCSIALPYLAVAGAEYRFRTTSYISIQQMLGSLNNIGNVIGSLRGLPLTLKLQPFKVKGGKSTVYCAHIELRARDMETARKLAMPGDAPYTPALPAAPDDDPDAPEFHPEPQEPEVVKPSKAFPSNADIAGEIEGE